ncbi:SDR family NAD(P)-dependent oxidoreductase [Thalassotalea euphylliae]|uniref:SDR family NAD(P)-dependent oxidoreductase n=1 Tax=Thalassotalea euphylliae TaxID=1655234 RepID=UPI00363E25F8
MTKTILLTGATDGIGFETAKSLISLDHTLLIHGRNPQKLDDVALQLHGINPKANVRKYVGDLSSIVATNELATNIVAHEKHIDVVINNAGIYSTREWQTVDKLDVRFAVNTLAPYLLTKKLLPLMPSDGRVVNLSSAAQATIELDAISGHRELSDGAAYAQSKLAITMWSMQMAKELGDKGPSIIAVNPKSFLGSKMVKEAYGVAGGNLSVGADILCRAALSDEFNDASGKYFDNDIGQFAKPHQDALNEHLVTLVVDKIEQIIAEIID